MKKGLRKFSLKVMVDERWGRRKEIPIYRCESNNPDRQITFDGKSKVKIIQSDRRWGFKGRFKEFKSIIRMEAPLWESVASQH